MLSNSFPKCLCCLYCYKQCMRISMFCSLPIVNMLCLLNFSHSRCISYGFPFLWWLLKCWTFLHMCIGHLGVLSCVSSSFLCFSVSLAVFVFLINKSALYNLNSGSLLDISICVLLISFGLCALCNVYI